MKKLLYLLLLSLMVLCLFVGCTGNADPAEEATIPVTSPDTGYIEARTLPFSIPVTLYPYAGGLAPLEDAGFGEYYRYGLVDAYGNQITEPIYVKISLLQGSDGEDAPLFWLLKSENQDPELVPHANYDSYTGKHNLYGLVSMDGTLFFDCEYSDISVCEDRILCTYFVPSSEGVNRLDVYDFQGNLITSSDSFPKLEGESFHFCTGYGEGYYVVRYQSGTEYNRIYQDYYIDETGAFAYGPFYKADAFQDGVAKVMPDESGVTFLRKDGTLFPESYDNLWTFNHGRAIAQDENGNTYLVDPHKNEPVISLSYLISQCSDTVSYSVRRNFGDEFRHCYDRDGNLLWTSKEADTILSSDLYYYDTGNHTILHSVSTGRELVFPTGTTAYYINGTTPYIKIYQTKSGEYTGTVTHILSTDLRVLFTFENNDSEYIMYDLDTMIKKDDGLLIRMGDTFTMYRSLTEPVGTFTVQDFISATLLPDNAVLFLTESSGELYGKDGKLLLRCEFDAVTE